MLELAGYLKAGLLITPLRFRRLLAFCAALLLTLFSHIASANNPGDRLSESIVATTEDLAVLTHNQSQDREIKGDEVHSFSITFGSNQLARLVVQRRGIDLVVIVISPDRSLAMRFENPAGDQSPIFGLIKPETSGTYIVEVRPVRKWLPKGKYQISWEEVPAPTLLDEKKLLAQQRVSEGRRQQLLETPESYRAAILNYEQALVLWRETADTFEEANTLQFLAQTHRARKDLQSADAYYNRALELRADDRQARAYTLLDQADAYYSLKSPRDSLPRYEHALRIFRENSNRRGEALVLSQIGLVHMRLFDWEGARNILEGALALNREGQDTYEEARVLNALGGVYDNQGQPERAMEFYKQARDEFHRLGDSAREGNMFINIGLHHDTWGEWREAVDSYNRAIDLIAAGHAAGEVDQSFANSKKASLFYNLGSLYISLGAYPEGLNYLQESLELRAANERGGTLTWLAYAQILLDQPERALDYCEEAIRLQEAAGDPRRAQTYTVMGMAQDALGIHEKAVQFFNKALEIQQSDKTIDLKGQAITLDKRGASFAAMGEMTKARNDLEAALTLWRTFKDRNGEALSLFQLARLERETLNLDLALTYAEAATRVIEPLRENVVDQQLRTSYFASKVDYYDLYIDLLMQGRGNGKSAERTIAAFEASERQRARGLLDMLTDANLGSGALTDPALSALVQKRLLLQRSVVIKSAQRSKALMNKASSSNHAVLDRELATLSADQDNLLAQIRSQYPQYATLMSSEPRRAKEIQQQLDADTLLLEFALGEKRSYAWVVSPDSIHGVELAPRDQIEVVARRVAEALTAKNRQEKNESVQEKRLRIDKADQDYLDASAALSKMILEPVASLLGTKRLVIVADGALQTIPFGSLPIPTVAKTPSGATTDGKVLKSNADRLSTTASAKSFTAAPQTPKPLISEHEIVYLPSASVLALHRRELVTRKVAPYPVAVIADPVFDNQDDRVARARGNNSQQRKDAAKTKPDTKASPKLNAQNSAMPAETKDASQLAGALRDVGLDPTQPLPRLNHSLEEARAIIKAASSRQSFSALDFKASRETATSPELSKYRVIHFATHGILDLEHPELSGIALSMVDEKGQARDGYLRLHEIYNLNLPAELVVLSACQTGVGKQIKGEGLIALTRGFMYAGAKSVVASLWKVDDAATAALMTEFYRQMFTNKLKPAAALREAQLKISKVKRWQSPYYWSGFFLQGDWN